MEQVEVSVPTEVMYDTKMNVEQTRDFVNKIIAIEYYKNYGISLGYCAEIAKMSKENFLQLLGTYGISVFHFDDKKEFLDEMNNA